MAVGEELRSPYSSEVQVRVRQDQYTFRKRGTFKEEICIQLRWNKKQMRYMHVIRALFYCTVYIFYLKHFMQKSRQVTLLGCCVS